jgi:serine/threonine-protein kinase RsbW
MQMGTAVPGRAKGGGSLLIRMRLTLPRDARYVGVMREVAGCVLRELGIPASSIDDVQLVVTEACSNAVRHAEGSDEYSVGLSVGAGDCVIEVTDFGPGFVPGSGGQADVDPDDEEGRGLVLMRALVDDLDFAREDDTTRVRLVKRWQDLHFQLAGATVDPNT